MSDLEDLSLDFTACFFDWYQVTFPDMEDPENLINKALSYFELSSVEVSRPRQKQYLRAFDLIRGSSEILHVCWGGCNQGVHLLSTGAVSHDVEKWLRQEWQGEYSVTRADVRVDTIAEGAFNYLYECCKDLSNLMDIKRDQRGDWDVEGSPSGRTYYLGGKTSSVQLRLYEKGKKEGGNKNWVRLELEVRPSKRAGKQKAASYSPRDFWNAARWSSLLYVAVVKKGENASSSTLGTVWRASDHERALIHMVKQYRGALQDLAGYFNDDWAVVGSYLKSLNELSQSFIMPDGSVDCNRTVELSGFGDNPYSQLLEKLIGR